MSKKWIYITLFLTLIFKANLSFAELTAYQNCFNRAKDDGQVALCMKAETNRILNQIQGVYLTLSQNRQASLNKPQTQTIDEELQQIYKPWFSYRNRFCSLYTKASEFMFGGEDYKRESCLLELTSNHLDLIQHLMPEAKGGLSLIKKPSDTYEACYKAALNNQQLETCMKAETTRLFQQIQQNYFALSQNEQTSVWNNGNGLIAGNLKDTYEYWLSYRDNFCTFFADTFNSRLGNKSVWNETCLLNLTADQNTSLETVLLNANSGGEEDDIEE